MKGGVAFPFNCMFIAKKNEDDNQSGLKLLGNREAIATHRNKASYSGVGR